MPHNLGLAQNWCYAMFNSGDIKGYRGACTRLRERFGESDNANHALILSRILILSPEAKVDSTFLVELAQRAVDLDPNNWWSHHVLAGAYIRDGKYEQALWTLDNADGMKLVPESPAVDSWLSAILNDSLRAIALLKFGRVNLGRAALQRVVKSTEQHLRASREKPFGEITVYWWNWYPIQAFRREAEELLQEADAKAKSAQQKR
jgi:hypothetical protein